MKPASLFLSLMLGTSALDSQVGTQATALAKVDVADMSIAAARARKYPGSELKDLGGPIQLHIGTADEDVPVVFHTTLSKDLRAIS